MSTAETNKQSEASQVDRLQCQVHEAAHRLAEAGNACAAKLREDFEHLRSGAIGIAELGRQRTRQVAQTLDERVRAEPVKALLIAAAVGAVAGAWFVRRR